MSNKTSQGSNLALLNYYSEMKQAPTEKTKNQVSKRNTEVMTKQLTVMFEWENVRKPTQHKQYTSKLIEIHTLKNQPHSTVRDHFGAQRRQTSKVEKLHKQIKQKFGC
jgi:beta-lactam-binding protein with PASTA domain